MAIDVTNPASRGRLWKSMTKAHRDLGPFRQWRQKLIKAYCGPGWGSVEGDTKNKTIENLISLTAQAYVVTLAAQNPRVTISTFDPNLKPFAKKFQVAIDDLLTEINFSDTLRKIVLDAFFSIGIAKIYRAASRPIEIENPEMPQEPGMFSEPDEWAMYRLHQQQMSGTILVDPGKPFMERISLDDFGFDMSARSWDQIRYAWHEYLIPRDDLLNDDRVSPEMADKLKSTTRWHSSLFQAMGGIERASDLGSNSEESEDVEDMVRVADVWLPRENKWGMMIEGGEFLFVDEWNGPEGGPFRILAFDDVPDNVMPKAPGMDLLPMHDAINSLRRKAIRQANSQRNITVYQSETDAKSIVNAKDGETVRSNNPDSVKFMNTPGPDQGNLAFGQMLDGAFSRQAGNLDAMAGLGPQSKTAKQDELIQQSLGGIQDKRRIQVVSFVSNCVQDLGQLLWTDQVKEINSQITIPGVSIPIPVKWTPEEREGDLLQYKFHVEPYSMVYRSPQQKATDIMGLVGQVVTPLLPAIQAAGGMFDVMELISLMAGLMDLPQLEDIVKFAVPIGAMAGGGMPGMPGGGGQSAPASTTREYVRHSVSGGSTPDAQRTQAIQSLLNSANQQQGGQQGGYGQQGQ